MISRLAVLLFAASVAAAGAESDALAISQTIQARHFPHSTLLDPIFNSPTDNQIVGYTRCGDSAIWTGHYLAAEAFRYKVTGSADALANVWSALHGIHSLRVVTGSGFLSGSGLLARCLMPTDWPFASSIMHEEAGHGIFNGTVDGK